VNGQANPILLRYCLTINHESVKFIQILKKELIFPVDLYVMHVINIGHDVFKANDKIADKNRKKLDKHPFAFG